MIRKLKYATIADIGVFKLKRYDSKKESELLEFCKINGISYLPSKCGKFVYKAEGKSFVKKNIEEHLKMNPYDLIFKESTLKKFEKVNHNEIRFIVEDEKIKGVVHIVDYNSSFINIELYKALLQFETNLRNLLISRRLRNEDFISWVEAKAKTSKSKKHWEKRLEDIRLPKKEEERRNANLFQTFYMRELLMFAISKGYIETSDFNIDDITNIRNLLAHNKDVTSMENKEGLIIYNFKGLKDFSEQIKSFFQAYEMLAEKVEQ